MKIKKVITIELHGESETDIEYAFEEATEQIRDGFTFGFDGNSTGSYRFDVATTDKSVVTDLKPRGVVVTSAAVQQLIEQEDV